MRMIDADKFEDELGKLGFAMPTSKDTEAKRAIVELIQGAVNAAMNVYEALDNQPTVNEWIPCSERLPLGEGELISDEVLICLESGYQRVATYHKKSEEWHDCYDTWISEKVVAWMPLPEPYKEE